LRNEHNEKRITASSALLLDNLEHPWFAVLGSAVRVSFETITGMKDAFLSDVVNFARGVKFCKRYLIISTGYVTPALTALYLLILLLFIINAMAIYVDPYPVHLQASIRILYHCMLNV